MGIAVVYHTDNKSNCMSDLYWGLFNINHTGQESCGGAVFDGKEIRCEMHKGLVRDFKPSENLKGYCGVGYTSNTESEQPLVFDSPKLGKFALAWDGYIANRDEVKKKSGGVFLTPHDVEIAANLISEGENFPDGIDILAKNIRGTYCLGILNQEGEVYVAKSPLAVRSLMFGQGKQGYATITESRAFRKIEMKPEKDFEPGEIAKINVSGVHQVRLVEGRIGRIRKHCSFLWGYYSWVDSVVECIPVVTVRERCGATLAKKDKQEGLKIDFALGIADSGKPYAEGYARGYGCPYSEGEIKYPYAIRSYTRPTQEKREREATSKISTVDERIRGKKIVVCDDSIRRGTQLKMGPIRYLRAAGAEEIHVRIGTPRNTAYCRVDTSSEFGDETLLANQLKTNEEIAEFLNVKSVKFIEIDEFVNAITEGSNLTRDDLCLGCYNRDFSFLEK
jgi:amidophosphoribosyltransferase